MNLYRAPKSHISHRDHLNFITPLLHSMISTLFFPLLPWLFQLTWFAWFLTVLVFLLSNGDREYRTSTEDLRYNFSEGEPCQPTGFHERYENTTAECLFARYRENGQLLR